MLRKELDGPVLRVVLDRPDVRNAFNDELIAALSDIFKDLDPASPTISDPLAPTIRAIVLSGEGKSFCAGGDLEWMRRASAYDEEENFIDAMKLAHLFQAVASAPVLVIARVHGAAFGGGCGLVACADVAICDSDAKFAFSEVKLGLLPATISPFVIPKIGAGNARALFATGETFNAEKALRIGLVHEVVPMEDLDAAVNAKLEAILACGPHAVSRAKKIALDPVMDLNAAARVLAKARSSDEGKEGVAAFLEKRPARWVSKR